MSDLYYTNASGDSTWENLLNWNTAPDGSGSNPTEIPWSETDGSTSASNLFGNSINYINWISYIGPRSYSVTIGALTNISPNGGVTGWCNIPDVTSYGNIYGGHWGVVWGEGGTFTNYGNVFNAEGAGYAWGISYSWTSNYGTIYNGYFGPSVDGGGVIYNAGTIDGGGYSVFFGSIINTGTIIQGSLDISNAGVFYNTGNVYSATIGIGFDYGPSSISNTGTINYENVFVVAGGPYTGIFGGQMWADGVWQGKPSTIVTNHGAIGSNLSPYSGGGISYDLNGSAYLSAPAGIQFAPNTGDFTIDWWQNQASLSGADGHPRVFTIGTYPSTSIAVSIEGGTFYLWINGSYVFSQDVSSGLLDTWHYFQIVRNSGTITIYQDGVVLGSPFANSDDIADITTDLWIGAEPVNGGGVQSGFIGKIADFRWEQEAVGDAGSVPSVPQTKDANTAVLASGIPFLQEGILAYWKLDDDGLGNVSLVDSTGNGNTLTNNGGVTLGTGIVGGDAVFDGTNYFTASSVVINSSQADFSFSCWVKADPASGRFVFIAPENGWRSEIGIVAEGGLLYATLVGIDNVILGNYTPSGNWDHIAVVVTGNNYTGYVNGFVAGSGTYYPYVSTGIAISSIPDHATTAQQFDEIGIWNRALTTLEVYNLYYNGTANTYPFDKTEIQIPPPDYSTCYYTNASGDYTWGNLANWTDANGNRNLTEIPWSNTDGSTTYSNLFDASGNAGVDIYTNLTGFGQCSINDIYNYASIFGGTFTGNGFTNAQGAQVINCDFTNGTGFSDWSVQGCYFGGEGTFTNNGKNYVYNNEFVALTYPQSGGSSLISRLLNLPPFINI